MGRSKPLDLREACVAEALRIIADAGVERLSIREVARRLGVSHQAPYKHFPSSDHLLAELVRRTYAAFAEYLENRSHGDSPGDEMRCMGEAYFRFATEHPLKYRLLFGTPLPDPELHPEMMVEARKAFTVLLEGVASMRGVAGPAPANRELHLDALFVWAVVHGMASILQTPAVSQLGLAQATLDVAMPHALQCIGHAMARPAAPTPSPARTRSPRNRS
jgi:AcrR family transcriptional regulator